jgi:hypothetical protein
MNIHYKIVEVWPNDHLIVARYWTDVISEKFLDSNQGMKDDGSPWRCRSDVSITVPVPAPTGKELEDLIMRNAPSYWLKTLEDVVNPEIDTSMSDIQSLLGQTFVKEVDLTTTANNDIVKEILSDNEIQSLIEKFNTTK